LKGPPHGYWFDGTRAWIVLMDGADAAGPLFLQAKHHFDSDRRKVRLGGRSIGKAKTLLGQTVPPIACRRV
jgi:hypothetical protein